MEDLFLGKLVFGTRFLGWTEKGANGTRVQSYRLQAAFDRRVSEEGNN